VNEFQLCWTCPAIIEKDATCPNCLEKFGGKAEADIRIDIIGKEEADGDDDDEATQCPICLDTLDKDIAVLNCGHMNHLKCFLDWSKAQGRAKATCCLCRADAPYYKRLASMAELSGLGKKPYFSSNVSQEEQADRFYRSSVSPNIPNPFQGEYEQNERDWQRVRVEREERNRRLHARLEEVMNMPSSNNNNNNNHYNYNINDNPLLVEEERLNRTCERCVNRLPGTRMRLLLSALVIATLVAYCRL
jgi:hypothetical protein